MRLTFLFLLTGLGLALPLARGERISPPEPQVKVARAVVAPRLLAEATDQAWSGPDAGVRLTLLGKAPDGTREVVAASSTSVEFRWDEAYLYVRFWCRASSAPWSPHGDRRDAPHYQGDVVEVFIDPVGDARQFVEIQVSAANGVFDKLYLLTGEARSDTNGLLIADVLKRDQWEFPEWNWDGLRSATAEWHEAGVAAGWVTDLALPAKSFLRRLGLDAYRADLVLRAHLLRNSAPESRVDPSGRAFLSWSWTQFPIGRPHRAPSRMGALILAP